MTMLGQHKHTVWERGGLWSIKAALAAPLQNPCGLRQNIQADLGGLRGLLPSYWEKPGELAQGVPAT